MLYDKNKILQILPHRDPLLFIDRVLDMNENSSIHSEWDLSKHSHLFDGHFPDLPVLPGNFLTEALAQNAGFLLLSSMKTTGQSNLPFLFSIDSMRFMRPVGIDALVLLCAEQMTSCGNDLFEFTVKAYIKGKKAASGRLTLLLKEASSL